MECEQSWEVEQVILERKDGRRDEDEVGIGSRIYAETPIITYMYFTLSSLAVAYA